MFAISDAMVPFLLVVDINSILKSTQFDIHLREERKRDIYDILRD